MWLAVPAQVTVFSKDHIDTLKIHRPSGNLYLGVYFMQDALQYLYLYGMASGVILDSNNLVELSGVLNYQGLRTRSTSNTGYLYFHTNLFRQKQINGKRKLNRISLEPFSLYQFDEDRGINGRLQAGVYASPVLLDAKKVRIWAGLGFCTQYDLYDMLPPDYEGWWDDTDWKQISNAITELDPDGNGFVSRLGIRGSLYLAFSGSFGEKFDMNLMLIAQQPFVSSFHGTALYSVSRDYQIPYPCLTMETVLNFRILSWLAMDLRSYLQHDRNQLTYYLPYFMYYLTFGVSFTI
jgi:hypothetical protein